MTITPTWVNDEKTIIQLNYTPPILSWAEYDAAVDLGWEMAKEVPHTVYVIHNPGDAAMPEGQAMPHLRRAMRSTPANVGVTIAIVHNLFARSILSVFMRITRLNNLIFAASLDEAHRIVRSMSRNPSIQKAS
jgi:hypothetical protein